MAPVPTVTLDCRPLASYVTVSGGAPGAVSATIRPAWSYVQDDVRPDASLTEMVRAEGSTVSTDAAPLTVVVMVPDSASGRPPAAVSDSATSVVDVTPSVRAVTSDVGTGTAAPQMACGTIEMVRLVPSGRVRAIDPSGEVVSVVVVPSVPTTVRVVPAAVDSVR